MKAQDAISGLAALAQESRLAIFRALVARGPQGYTPGELIEKMDVPAPTLSFHLKELQRAGLLKSKREGRFIHYSADFDVMRSLVAFLTDNCCSLADGEFETECKPSALAGKRCP